MTLEQSAPGGANPYAVTGGQANPSSPSAMRPVVPNVVMPGVPGMSGPRLLISVYPKQLELKLRHEGIKNYVMPAAEKGSFQTLLVQDTFAWCRNFHADRKQLYPAPVPASAVADNLLQRWSEGMVGTKDGLGPGILICAGLEPTPEEIAQANAKQDDYFRHLIAEADAFEANPNLKQMPTDVHRLAAEWMGTQDRKWFKPITRHALKSCPACAEEIREQAKICKHCGANIREFQEKEARLAVKDAQAAKVA